MGIEIVVSCISVTIALSSALVAYFMKRASDRNFLLSYRPYLVAVSPSDVLRAKDGLKYDVGDPCHLMLVGFRTPARLISGKLWFGICENGRDVARIREDPIPGKVVLPGENVDAILRSELDITNITDNLGKNQDFMRRVKIKYEWAGNNKGNKTYSYECTWKFCKQRRQIELTNGSKLLDYGNWEVVKQEIV